METEDKVRENRMRRWAKRLGLSIKKSRAKRWNLDNQGGYMIIEPFHNLLFYGDRYNLTLDDVEEILEDYEKKIST